VSATIHPAEAEWRKFILWVKVRREVVPSEPAEPLQNQVWAALNGASRAESLRPGGAPRLTGSQDGYTMPGTRTS
jgi:hypothetical protein